MEPTPQRPDELGPSAAPYEGPTEPDERSAFEAWRAEQLAAAQGPQPPAAGADEPLDELSASKRQEVERAQDRDKAAQQVSAGQPVSFTYQDAGGVDVVRYGVVLEVVDEGARVAWLTDISDPIPHDQLAQVRS